MTFVVYDDEENQMESTLKADLKRGRFAEFSLKKG